MGFLFQVIAPKLGPANPVASGGRYDGLLGEMGATAIVPAVGSCIHAERLVAALGGKST